ncbi:MAG: hypothetical protein R3C61_20975 [Bacteroidia bacterium]
MAKVILKSWRNGSQKIALVKLQVDILGKSLREAKTNVDLLLSDNKVIVEINDVALAKKFLEEAENLGVYCKLEVG